MDRDSLSNLVIINEVDNVPIYHVQTKDMPLEPLVATEVIAFEPQPILTGEATPNPENIISWNTNFRDPVFIDNFVGHLQDSPPICQWLSESFTVFGKSAVSLILWTVVHIVFAVISTLPSKLITHSSGALLDIVAICLQLTLTTMMFAWDIVGMCYILKLLKAHPDSPRDTNSQFRLFYTTFMETIKNGRFLINNVLLALLLGVSIGLGFVCLIIPGVWMAVSFCLSSFIYLEHHEDLHSIVDTLRISKNVVNRHWCAWFGFCILTVLLFCLVIFTPLAYIAFAIALRDTVGLRVTQV